MSAVVDHILLELLFYVIVLVVGSFLGGYYFCKYHKIAWLLLKFYLKGSI